MNAEISKIRKIRNYKEEINGTPTRIKEDRLLEMVYQLNINLNDIYIMQKSNDINIDKYVEAFIANIYMILNMFNEMGIYPDYFYDEIVKMNIEYKKLVQNNSSIRGNYRLLNEINLSARVSETIKKGLENGYYRIQAYQKKDINEDFLEMIGFFQVFNIPYNIKTKEQCKKAFNDIHFNHTNIIHSLLNSDYLFEDIEYLSRLLFEYLSFFVSMGIYPKEHLDNYINSVENVKHK